MALSAWERAARKEQEEKEKRNATNNAATANRNIGTSFNAGSKRSASAWEKEAEKERAQSNALDRKTVGTLPTASQIVTSRRSTQPISNEAAKKSYYSPPEEFSSQQEYDSWRSSVRSTADVEAELSSIDSAIEELEQKKLLYTPGSYSFGVDGNVNIPEPYLEINKEIEALEAQRNMLNEELNYAKYFGYTDLRGSEDWEAMSAAGESQLGSNLWQRLWDSDTQKAYDYINNIGGYRDNLEAADSLVGHDTSELDAYRYMSDEEIGTFNYIYNTQGEEAAAEYLNWIQEGLNAKYGQELAAGLSNDFQRIGYGLRAGINQFGSGVQQLFSDERLPTSATQYAGQAVREQLGETGPSVFGNSLGQMAYDALSVTANMAPSILVASVTGGLGAPAALASGVGAATLGASASGNAYNQALADGYAKDDARAYALLVGASEASLQYLLGGISKLGGAASQKVLAKVAAADNALLRVAGTGLIKIGSEVTEEELQNFIEPALRSLIFNEEYDAPEVEELLYTALLTAVTTGGMEAGSILSVGGKQNAETGAQFRGYGDETVQAIIQTGLESGKDTESYQLAQELKKQQEQGKTISDHKLGTLYEFNKAAIEDENLAQEGTKLAAEETVIKAQKRAEGAKGNATTRNALTGYGEYGSRAFVEIVEDSGKSPDQVRVEFQSAYEAGLTNLPRERVSLISNVQETAYNAGRQDAIMSMKKAEIKGATVWGKEGGLIENEFSAKLETKTHDTLQGIGKATGTKIIVEEIPAELNANGYYKDSDGTIHIDVNTEQPVMTVVKHELTHRMQSLAPKEYEQFRNYAVQVESANLGYGSLTPVENMQQDYLKRSGGKVRLSTEEAMDEIAANFTEKILTDEKALHDFVTDAAKSEDKRTMAQKFFDAVRDFLKKVKTVFKGDKAKMDAAAKREFGVTIEQLEKAEQLWKETYTAATKAAQNAKNAPQTRSEDGVKYKLKQVNGKNIVWIENSGLSSKQLTSHTAVAEYIAQHIGEVYTIIESGQKVFIGKDLPGEYTHSKYTDSLRKRNPTLLKAKNRAANDFGLLIETATNRRWEKTKHEQSKDAKYGMYRYDSAFAFPVKDGSGKITNVRAYDAELLIRNASDGKKYLYDIVNIKENTASAIDLQQRETRLAAYEAASRGSVTPNNVAQDGENVKFSLKDSAGRELSQEQQEYFKDSKVRDSKGNLKVVYHGSGAQFTKFSYDFMSTHGSSEGQGFYFTDKKEMAQGYERGGGQLLEGYLDIRKPLSDSKVTMKRTELTKLLKAVDPTGDDVILNYDPQGGMGYPSKAWYNRALSATVEMMWDGNESDSEIMAEIANSGADTETLLRKAREMFGYDGYIVEGKYDDAAVYVAFTSEQFKNVDNRKPTSDPDIRFSFKRAERNQVLRAEQMERDGNTRDTIWSTLGVTRDAAGNWVSEIDDSGAVYYRGGDARFRAMHPDYVRYQNLYEKLFEGKISDAEHEELIRLDDIWGNEYGRLSERVDRGNAQLLNILDHPALYEEFPELQGMNIRFEDMRSGMKGQYDSRTGTIILNSDLRSAPESTLIHEIQHALQHKEQRPNGASVEYWRNRIDNGEVFREHDREIAEAEKRKNAAWDKMSDELKNKVRAINRESIEAQRTGDFDRLSEMQEELFNSADGDLYAEYDNAIWDMRLLAEHNEEISAEDLYYRTAGEIEARLAQQRLRMSAEERRVKTPDFGWDRAVFAKGATRFSLKDSDYMKAVDSGDMETAQRMVDEAARVAGFSGAYYHGSKSEFTVFSKEKRGQSNSDASIGFWFTETAEGAQRWNDETWYGDGEGKVYKTFLDLKNPKVFETADNRAQIDELYKGYEDIDKEMSLYDSMYYFDDGRRYHNERYDYDRAERRRVGVAEWDVFKAIVKKWDADTVNYYMEKVSEGDRQTVKADAERYLELHRARKDLEKQISELRYSDAYELFRTDLYKMAGMGAEDANIGGTGKYIENKGEVIKSYVEKLKREGHDGIIIRGTEYDSSIFGGVNNQYVVFESEQVKSADPVTYDNDGNVIPLSERFNKENKDIRFSLKGQSELMKENAKLKEVNEALKAQFKLTKFAKVDAKKLESFTKKLLKDYNSGADRSEIQSALDELYTYIANGEDGQTPAWNEVQKRAYEVATSILSDVSIINDEMYQSYSGLRDYLRNTGLKLDKRDEHDLGGYENLNEFRKANFGRIKIANDGLPVDSAYQELASMYPEFFDAEEYTHPADQLLHIAEVLDSLQPYEENPFSRNMRENATWLANDIIERFYELPQAKPTFADKAERRLTQQKIKDGKKLERVRTQKDERIAKLIEQQREKVKATQTKERTKRETAVKKLKEQQKAKEAKMSESRKAKMLREKILRHIQPMKQKLLRPSDKQHVPQELRNVVAALLDAINLESQYTIDPVTGKRQRGGDGLPAKRSEAFQKVREQYTKIITDEFGSAGGMTIDPALLGIQGSRSMLDEIIAMRDVPLDAMTIAQLQTVWDAVRAIEHSIVTAGKALSQSKYETRAEIVEAFQRDTATRRVVRSGNNVSGLAKDLETPYTFFSYYGRAGLDFFRMLRNAQDSEQIMQDELAGKVQEVISKEQRNRLEKTSQKFTTVRGEELTLSKAHVMEIYLLNKRPQARQHLLNGGIMQPEVGRLKRGAEPTLLTEADIAKIVGSLSKEEQAIADAFQKITLLLAEWGNRASMKVYGYEKFTDPNYWTIRSSSEQIKQTVEKNRDNPRSIANMGSAKQLNPAATNTLEVGGIFSTFDAHASEMLTYSAWLAVMEDANSIYNFKLRDEDGNIITGKTMQTLLNKYGGAASTKYWLELMKDIQNGIRGPGDTWTGKALDKVIGNVRKASVAGNLRVVVQQPSAYMRALAVLDIDSMTFALGKNAAVKPIADGWKKAVKYAPIAARKAAGGFEIGNSPAQLAEVMYKPTTKGGKALQTVKDAPFALPGLADEMTWGTIWNACEYQVGKNDKTLKKGSEEFYNAVAELFTDVIDQTQVVDGVLQRSQVMRSGNGAVKQMTAFMGEPTITLNLVMRAYNNLRNESDNTKRSAARKVLGRAVAAVMLTSVLNAFAQSLVDGLRDDDDEKDYWERVWANFVGLRGDEETWADFAKAILIDGNVANNLNPASWVVGLKDIMSLIQGYSIERMDASAIGDFISALTNLAKSFKGDSKWTPAYATVKAIATGAKIVGSSFSNVMRDVESIVRSFQIERGDVMARYNTEKKMYDMTNQKGRFLDILYQAYEQGDEETYKLIVEDMIANGIDAKSIENGMKSRAKDNLPNGPVDDFTAGIGIKPSFASEEETESSFSINDLSGDEYIKYMDYRGDMTEQIINYFQQNGLGSMDDETAKALYDAAYSYAHETALERASGGEYDSDKAWINKAQDASDLGLTASEYIMLMKKYSSDITAEGVYDAYAAGVDVEDYLAFKDGTKDMKTRSEMLDFVETMGLNDDEFNALLAYSIFDLKSVSENLEADQYDDYARSYAKLMDVAEAAANGIPGYAGFNEEAREKIEGYVESFARETALISINEDYDASKWIDEALEALTAGVDLSTVFWSRAYASTLTGEKKKQFKEWLDKQGLSRAEKNALLELNGWKADY